ncbi:MAG TPA: hypothetical protein VMT22_05525 [Terriglobales bacterium]|jgi:hypothetical protein|nr:hypothetical protein [Terriglobales bacterium]
MTIFMIDEHHLLWRLLIELFQQIGIHAPRIGSNMRRGMITPGVVGLSSFDLCPRMVPDSGSTEKPNAATYIVTSLSAERTVQLYARNRGIVLLSRPNTRNSRLDSADFLGDAVARN